MNNSICRPRRLANYSYSYRLIVVVGPFSCQEWLLTIPTNRLRNPRMTEVEPEKGALVVLVFKGRGPHIGLTDSFSLVGKKLYLSNRIEYIGQQRQEEKAEGASPLIEMKDFSHFTHFVGALRNEIS